MDTYVLGSGVILLPLLVLNVYLFYRLDRYMRKGE